MPEQKKQKTVSMVEQGKGISVLDEAKNSLRRVKDARAAFLSDAERNLDGVQYRLGDMVWAKVKSHPWWPGQLYDPKLASASAMELKRESCVLVAFFGDSTFGWFAEAELIPFGPNFAQKSSQTTAHNFVEAVEDALDEVRRRVKTGLTCGCCITDSISEEDGRPGLLYDRQLRDVRSTFKPAILFSFTRELACSPFSSSHNMLRSTIARAQADAFRLLASCKKASEDDGTQVPSDLLLSHQIKALAPQGVRISGKSKDKAMIEKGINKKQVPSVQSLLQENKELHCIKSTIENRANVDKVGKVRKHSKNKSAHGEKGGAKRTSLKNKGLKPEKNVLRDSIVSDATVFSKSLASTDAFNERDAEGSGWNARLSDMYEASAASDEGLQNASSSVARNSLALIQEKKTAYIRPKKVLGTPTNDKAVMVHTVDANESEAFPKKSTGVSMQVEDANIDVGQASKTKVVKMAKTVNPGVDQEGINVKIGTADMHQLSKTKRMAGHDATEGIDASLTNIKRQKVSTQSKQNDDLDHSLKEHTGASDSMLQQHSKGAVSDQPSGERDIRQPHVEPSALMDAIGDVSATATLVIDSGVNRLQQDEALQGTPEDYDALSHLLTGSQGLKQGDQVEEDNRALSSLLEENNMDVSKKRKKKTKGLDPVEPAIPEGDGAGVPLGIGAKLLAHKAKSSLQAKKSADIGIKKRKKPEDKSSVEALKPDRDRESSPVSLLEHSKQKNPLGVERAAECSLQAENVMDSNKKKRRLKAANSAQPLNSEGRSATRDVKENSQSTPTRVMEGQTPNAYLLEVHNHSVEALQVTSQTEKELLAVRHGLEVERAAESVKEAKEQRSSLPLSKVTVSKKRAPEERELSKDSTKRRKVKTFTMNSAAERKVKTFTMSSAFESYEQRRESAEQHEDSTKKREGIAQAQDLRKGLLSVTADPPNSIEEESPSPGHANSRKALLHEPKRSLTALDVLDVMPVERGLEHSKVSESPSEQSDGFESLKTVQLARVQTEVSAGYASREVVTDISTVNDGEEVFGGGKSSKENNTPDSMTMPSKLLKKPVSLSKRESSSSISLRPAVNVKIPLRGSKEVLNRFGQRVPRLSDEAEKLGSHPSRTKNPTAERALMISFPPGFPLPSELQLTEAFAKFGELNLPLTRIDSRSGCARVIYRRAQDAEAALSSMKEKPVYENARFWLKPRDADVGDLPKQASKHMSSEERPAFPRGNKVEAASDKPGIRTALDKRVIVSIENDGAPDKVGQIEDRSSMPKISAARKAGVSENAAHVSLQSHRGVLDVQLLRSTYASEKSPIGNLSIPNAGYDNMEGIRSIHFNAAGSSLCSPPGFGCRPPLGTPANMDISDTFLVLLHQLHDLVVSMGFTF